MQLDLRNRHVVVTGGSGGLGAAVVQLLLEQDATCHLPLHSTRGAASLPAAPRDRLRVVAGVDLADDAAVRSFYDGLPELWASIHCVGGFDMAQLGDATLEHFSAMWTTNCTSAFLCCREAARVLRSRSAGAGGRIVNVAARAALEPRSGAGMSAYTASKAAVAALTAALAEELAPDRIWVNAVAPSILDTAANRRAMPAADHTRWPKVEEVAATIVFLASPANTATRGGVIPVYGRT